MFEIRLGDVVDDYCIKCRRLTNHSIVSIVEGAAAKVRCRSCYNDHDYRNEQAPPTKKELKKLALFNEVLAGAVGAGLDLDAPVEFVAAESEAAAAAESSATAAKPVTSKKTTKKSSKAT